MRDEPKNTTVSWILSCWKRDSGSKVLGQDPQGAGIVAVQEGVVVVRERRSNRGRVG